MHQVFEAVLSNVQYSDYILSVWGALNLQEILASESFNLDFSSKKKMLSFKVYEFRILKVN